MALFGTFEDITPDEVLSLVEDKEGVLEIGNDIRIYLKGGRIVGMEYKGRRLDNRTHYLAVIMDMLKDRESSFRFYRQQVEEFGEGVPVNSLLMEAIVKDRATRNLSSSYVVEDDLPFQLDLSNRRRLSRILSQNEDLELVEFLKDAYLLLKEGITPVELAERLSLPLDWVKYMLYRLRIHRVVKVQRKEADSGIVGKVRTIYNRLKFKFFGG